MTFQAYVELWRKWHLLRVHCTYLIIVSFSVIFTHQFKKLLRPINHGDRWLILYSTMFISLCDKCVGKIIGFVALKHTKWRATSLKLCTSYRTVEHIHKPYVFPAGILLQSSTMQHVNKNWVLGPGTSCMSSTRKMPGSVLVWSRQEKRVWFQVNVWSSLSPRMKESKQNSVI